MLKSIFHKKKRNVAKTNCEDNKKENNVYLKLIGKWNNDDYPLKMRKHAVAAMDIFYNNVYLYKIIDDIEYVILEKRDANCFSSSAYIKNQDGIRDRIGTTFFYYTQYGDIYLDRYVVHPDFYRKGVGGNLLMSIICFEYKRLEADKNIYVRASADSFYSKLVEQQTIIKIYK